MRIGLVVNPASGRGAADRTAQRFEASADTIRIPLPPRDPAEPWSIPPADALAVFGGDGTVGAVAARLAGLPGPPIYHVPCGNENLVARTHRMTADPRRLLQRLRDERTRRCAALSAGDRLGLLMVSVGPDAGAVRRHEQLRARARRLGHLNYAGPVVAELLRPSLGPLRVTADGRPLVDGDRGWLVVACARAYALGMDPASRADPFGGALDVVFMPASTSLAACTWAARARLGRHRRSTGNAAARCVRVEAVDRPLPIQLDGEWLGTLEPGRPLEVRLLPDAVPVLA